MSDWVEQNLQFSFAVPVDKPDTPTRKWPQKWSRVDFVLDEEQRDLYIEVKDYAHPESVARGNDGSLASTEFRNNLIDGQLVPKARDTFCTRRFEGCKSKPVDYVVILTGLSDVALLPDMQDRLRRRLERETETAWKYPYVRNVVIVSIDEFNSRFSPHSVVRV